MRKIRLSDMDLELFDIEIGPNDYMFYQKHKDAFKTMWREQGKPFWTRFQITFRSFTVKHGIIKQMNIDSPKFQNLLDQAFIFIHEQFVDGKESTAKNFIDDVARLAQNQDKFPALDSKSFAKDPFFTRDTRELFRKFFGPPDQKASYLKVYILCPVYLRFGGSVCRCLIRWMDAPTMEDPNDDSYWVPPQPNAVEPFKEEIVETTMCSNCVDDCGTRYFHEKIMGSKTGPVSLSFWTLGDPRFNDPDNPLFAPHLDQNDDWRNLITVDLFRDFYNYARYKYGNAEDKCNECQRLKRKRDKFLHVCKASKKKKKLQTKEQVELIKDLKEVRTRINELEEEDIREDYEERIHNIIKEKPRVREALEEVGMKAERKEKLEKLHAEQLKAEEVKAKPAKKNKRLKSPDKKNKKAEKTQTDKDLNEKNIGDGENILTDDNLKEKANGSEKETSEKMEINNLDDKSQTSNDSVKENLRKSSVVETETLTDQSVEKETSRQSSVESQLNDKSACEPIIDNQNIGKETQTADKGKDKNEEIEKQTAEKSVNKVIEKEVEDKKIIDPDQEVTEPKVETDKTDKTSKDNTAEKCELINETDKKDMDNTLEKSETNSETAEMDKDKTSQEGETNNAVENNAVDINIENEKKETDINNGTEKKENDKDKCQHETHTYRFLSDKDLTANKNIVSGFKVIKIEDQDNGLFEVNVSAACLKSDDEEDSYSKKMNEKLKSQELNNFILSANILREKIQGLPQRLEWWEGRGFAVAIVNYEEEEKEFTKKWTNFTLKINGYEESAIKQTLIKLLIYVTKRKRRICYGWNMEVDDIVACILPEESPDIEDLSISISRGFRFEDRLTEFERETLLKHYPNLNLDLVLCGMEKGAAVKTMEKKGGKEKLRKIIDAVAEKEILSRDLPVVDVEKLRKKLNYKADITKADILWEQLIRKPENFEFYVLLKRDFVLAENDWWKNGMRSTDIRLYNTKNPPQKICPICKIVGADCSCEKPIIAEPKIVEFVESTDFDKVTVLGDENGPKLPNMKYTETNLVLDNNEKEEKLKSKASKLARRKEKRIELSDLPAKFLEAGIDAEKTTITIPSRDEEPMMGRVPIPLKDKLEKLAPVPGVQSSLNFTFQNGKKEQTITVTLGAYMPEDKINEIQEKKERVKIMEEEEKRKVAQALVPKEKKEKQDKKKKEKSKSKSPQKVIPKHPDHCDDPSTRKERLTQITTRFLKEIFNDDEKVQNVTKALHQSMGMTNKKQPEKKKINEARPGPHGKACSCPHPEDVMSGFQCLNNMSEAEAKERMNDMAEEIMDLLDNKRTSRKYREAQNREFEEMRRKVFDVGGAESVEAEKERLIQLVLDMEAEDEKKAKAEQEAKAKAAEQAKKPKGKAIQSRDGKKHILELDDHQAERKIIALGGPKEECKEQDSVHAGKKRKKSTDGKQEKNPETDGSPVDKIPDEDVNNTENQKAEETHKHENNSEEEKSVIKSGKLKTCGSCEKIEPTRRAFKKCQKCKEECVLDVRYYCSRECQVDDWKKKHKMEHRDGLLG